MIIKEQKPICIQKTCPCWIDRWDIISAILWWTNKPVVRVKKVFMYGIYPAISIHGKKIHLHRLLMAWKIRMKLTSKEYVHHKDGNVLNNHLSNLELETPYSHQSRIHKDRKQSQEHINKRIDATTKTRYGHSIYEHSNLLKGGK